jgi:hypothetical protein
MLLTMNGDERMYSGIAWLAVSMPSHADLLDRFPFDYLTSNGAVLVACEL